MYEILCNIPIFQISIDQLTANQSRIGEIILLGIGSLASFGVICALVSFLIICMEYRRLHAFRKDHEKTTLNITSLEKELKASSDKYILNQRLFDIISLFSRTVATNNTSGNTKEITAPSIQDLHLMTEQHMEGHMFPKMLELISTVLLICGICGTLFGVHECLTENPNATVDLAQLALALEPSKWAVLATIILLLLRGFYRFLVDKFLSRLDRYTMTRILPELMPASDIHTSLSNFSKSVDSFSNKIEEVASAARSMTNGAHTFEEKINTFGDIEDQLKTMINSLSTTNNNISERYKELQNHLDTNTNHDEIIRESSTKIMSMSETFKDSVNDLCLTMSILSSQLTNETKHSTSTQNELNDLLDSIKEIKERYPIENYKQAINNFNQSAEEATSQLNSDLQELVESNRQIEPTIKKTESANLELTKQANLILEELERSKNTTNHTAEIGRSLREQLQAMSTQIDVHDELYQSSKQSIDEDVILSKEQLNRVNFEIKKLNTALKKKRNPLLNWKKK